MTSRTLRLSDGSTVRVLEAGAGDPLLLIHGVGLRAEAWGPQMRLEAHVFAVDMPGHGESSPLPEGARLPEYVAWAARVIEAIGIGPMSVAGHSMGSLIAGGLAIERPEYETVKPVTLEDAPALLAEDVVAITVDPRRRCLRVWFVQVRRNSPS